MYKLVTEIWQLMTKPWYRFLRRFSAAFVSLIYSSTLPTLMKWSGQKCNSWTFLGKKPHQTMGTWALYHFDRQRKKILLLLSKYINLQCTGYYFWDRLHELFCQFISWTNWVNSGKFMDNCWISCQVMTDMKKVYDDLIIINLYRIW